MGLFSFLKSDKPEYADKVWKTRPVAIKGMITEALLAIRQNQVPVVFCFFEDTISEVIFFLNSAGVPHFHLSDSTTGEAINQGNVVFVCDAFLILSSSGLMGLFKSISATSKIQFLFAGHYPLPARENKFIEKLSVSYPQSSITFFSSMDDPAFEPFGIDRIKTMLDAMGLQPDECIEHTMVSKSMARVREKIESTVHNEVLTKLESEWFLKNLKK